MRYHPKGGFSGGLENKPCNESGVSRGLNRYWQRAGNIQFENMLAISSILSEDPNRREYLKKVWDRLKDRKIRISVFEYAARCQDTERTAILLNKKWDEVETELEQKAHYSTVWLVLAKVLETQKVDDIESFEDRARVFLQHYADLEKAGFNKEIRQNAVEYDDYLDWATKTKESWGKLKDQGIEEEVLCTAVYYDNFESKALNMQKTVDSLVLKGYAKEIAFTAMSARNPENEAKRLSGYIREFDV
jgi:hypothetical protein